MCKKEDKVKTVHQSIAHLRIEVQAVCGRPIGHAKETKNPFFQENTSTFLETSFHPPYCCGNSRGTPGDSYKQGTNVPPSILGRMEKWHRPCAQFIEGQEAGYAHVKGEEWRRLSVVTESIWWDKSNRKFCH